MQEVPSLSSSAGSGQHSDPVWQVRWVDRGLEQEERLVTISTDGRVTQWATTKVIGTSNYLLLRHCCVISSRNKLRLLAVLLIKICLARLLHVLKSVCSLVILLCLLTPTVETMAAHHFAQRCLKFDS